MKSPNPLSHPENPAPGASLGSTWPLFSEPPSLPFPEDPKLNLTPFRPDRAELDALGNAFDLPETSAQAQDEQRRLRETVPPSAPDWVRAASTLADWLNQRVLAGSVDSLEKATIARTWTAFALGGTTVPQIRKVAHVVSRAHGAIRETPRGERELQAALIDCARVMHSGLPLAIQTRMPLERTVQVARMLRSEPDPWAAVVSGTSELLGWADYARAHTAAIIGLVIEQGR